MNGFATSPNPYLRGIQPKRFLDARVIMLKNEQKMKRLPASHYERRAEENKRRRA